MPFFETSKLLGIFVEPLNLLVLLLALAFLLMVAGQSRAGLRCLGLAVFGFVLVAIAPIGDAMLGSLERRFPASALPAHIDGVIMLGGAQKPLLTAAHHQPAFNGAAERMTTFMGLMRRYPKAKFVFSGGSGDPRNPSVTEADTVRLALREQGLDPSRVLYESQSRNTYENVINSKRVVIPRPGEVWVMVTSAGDIPRAMGVFRKAGWAVIPVPCDYDAQVPKWFPRVSLIASFEVLNHALHEWVGLVAYYFTGKTDQLFPRP